MEQLLNSEETELCKILSLALHGKKSFDSDRKIDWNALMQVAEKHKVLPFLFDILEEADLPQAQRMILEQKGQQTVQQSYRLLFLSKSIIEELKEHGIDAILLKGSGVAAFYPVPEYRKSGDVDILMKNKEEAERACEILEKHGFHKKEHQAANHHIACTGDDGIEVELHVTLAEAFDSEKINAYLQQCQASFFEHRKLQDVMGVTFNLATDSYQAFYLLLHMLQHFLRAGFGLKLLCDWVVFWEKPVCKEEKDTFIQLLEGSGLIGFASIITAVCVKYLQLDRKKVAFLVDRESFDKKTVTSFMKEVFEAEEFGHSDTDRMVVLRGTKLTDYIREFHHQMKLTYPKASRCIVLYPALWVMTLCGFLYRNRKVRGTSSRAIMKKTHKRSKFMEQIHLFR